MHKDSVVVAVLPPGASAPTRVERHPHDLRKLERLFERLFAEVAREHPGLVLHACYEASGAGYVLQRAITRWGYHCDVIAPPLIPTKPGHRRKHDRYDAGQLARLYRSGELTVIHVPEAAEESLRDLVRCRTTFQRQLHRARQFVLKFLARRGVVYDVGVTHWTRQHQRWLEQLVPTGVLTGSDATVFTEYLGLVGYAEQRRDALDAELRSLVLPPAVARNVAVLESFRGVAHQAALVLATELVDWRRFESPRALSAFFGLVPREASSGTRERRGSITKAGNSHCRHVLVQAAWSYRHPPRVGEALKTRQQGQPPAVITTAWKAQHRLHKRYRHLLERRGKQVAIVAVARELVGFLWAALQHEHEHEPNTAPAPVGVAA